jgi:hypothetical protein
VTNVELIRRALLEIGVIAGSKTPSAQQAQDALVKLNQLAEEWEEAGIKLGWCQQLPADLSGTAPLPPYAERGVTLKLAMALAPTYGGAASVTTSLIAECLEAWGRVQLKAALKNLKPSDTKNMPRAEGQYGTENILTGN